MFRLTLVSLFMAGLLLTVSSAEEKIEKKVEIDKGAPKKAEYPKKVEPKTKVGPVAIPGDVEIHFLNGSKVRMLLESEKLDVMTAYGKLTVPVKDVRAIEFGLHFPEGMEEKIAAAIKGLSSSDYREREKADKALIDLGPFSYPAVLDASRTKELEAARRAKEILTKLQSKHNKKDLKTSVDDRLITNNFTIVGRILTTTVKAKTEYFGEQELTLAKMRTLKSMGGASFDTEVAIDASKYAGPGVPQWLETDYHCDGRTAITITARGMIDVWPQQGGGFMSGPSGFQNTRNGGGMGGLIKGGRKIGNNINSNQHNGMLIAKVGENGDFFQVGDSYEGIPDGEGKIYFTIGPSQWNVQCNGQFDIKISRKD
jgi:hypothetical protein